MDTMRVGVFEETDRPALCRMLAESEDFPQHLLYLHRRAGSHHTTLVARRGEQIDGMLGGSFDADLAVTGVFDVFELPPAPHAFLDRIHVREAARGRGVGRALIEAFAFEAMERECTFIGGSIDLSPGLTARKVFFEGLGFSIREHGNIGADPTGVLAAIMNS